MSIARSALLGALLLPSLALAQAGRVLLAVGDVVAVRAGQELRLGPGAPIQSGDTIRLGPASNAQIRMSDESIISLRERTVFRIDEYVYSGQVDGREKSLFSLLAGGMRTVTGVIGNLRRTDKYAVRTATSTIGIRGTHYTLRECKDDCFEGGGATASAPIHLASAAQNDAGPLAQLKAPPGAKPVPNGTYGGVTDGRIGVANKAADVEFGANQYFFVADQNTAPAGLLAPPGFLHDRLEGQARAKGQKGKETGETLAQGGINAESRPSDVPAGPKPSDFIVTEQRTAAGDPLVVSGTTPTIALVGALFDSNSGGFPWEPGNGGAFLAASNLMTSGSGTSAVLTDFTVPPGFLAEPGGGSFVVQAVSAGTIINETVPNSLNANWGRWTGGSITELDSTPTPNPVSPTIQLHYLFGPLTPPEVVAAKSGAFSLFVVQGTTPTNNLGELGTFSAPGWTVNFTSRMVSAPAGTGFSFPSQSWTFTAFSTPIQFAAGKGAFIDSVVGGTCSAAGPGPCGAAGPNPASLGMTGIFMGPAGDHLGVGFNAVTNTGAAHASTAKIFTCSPPC